MTNLSNQPSCIRAELLQPGDIILSKAPTLRGKVISNLTKGCYSHASIVVDKTLYFEATDIGLGYTSIKLFKVEMQPDGHRLLWDVSEYETIDVFRHPEITLLSNSMDNHMEFVFRLMDILKHLNGLQYPGLDSFANVSDLLEKSPKTKQLLLRFVEMVKSKGKNKIIPGLFCSELIVHCYNELGVDIFFQPVEGNEVSPVDLANPDLSKLQVLENIKYFPDNNCQNNEKLLELFNMTYKERDHTVKPLVDLQVNLKELENTVKQLQSQFERK